MRTEDVDREKEELGKKEGAEKTTPEAMPTPEPEASTVEEIKHLDNLENTIKTGTEKEIQAEEQKIDKEIINGEV